MTYDNPYFVEYRHVICRWKALELPFQILIDWVRPYWECAIFGQFYCSLCFVYYRKFLLHVTWNWVVLQWFGRNSIVNFWYSTWNLKEWHILHAIQGRIYKSWHSQVWPQWPNPKIPAPFGGVSERKKKTLTRSLFKALCFCVGLSISECWTNGRWLTVKQEIFACRKISLSTRKSWYSRNFPAREYYLTKLEAISFQWVFTEWKSDK